MSGGYNAKVVNPSGFRAQTQSGSLQTPFFFGGSQVPTDLFLARSSFSGSGIMSPQVFDTKKGAEIFHKGATIKIPRKLPFA